MPRRSLTHGCTARQEPEPASRTSKCGGASALGAPSKSRCVVLLRNATHTSAATTAQRTTAPRTAATTTKGANHCEEALATAAREGLGVAEGVADAAEGVRDGDGDGERDGDGDCGGDGDGV